MKKQLLLLLTLSGLALSGCDALDSFFGSSNSSQQNSNDDNSNGEGNNGSTNQGNTDGTEDNSSNTNQGNTDNNNGNGDNTNTGTGDDNNTGTGDNTNTGTGDENNTGTGDDNNTGKGDDNGGNDDNTNTGTGDANTNQDPPPNPPDDDDERYVSFGYKSYDLVVGKKQNFIIYYYPSYESFKEEEIYGTFASSNESVATVSQSGTVQAKSEGQTVITFTTDVDHFVASMTVYVHSSAIKYEYTKVDDVDDIKLGDELVFACPDFGVAASVNEKEYWVDVTSGIKFDNNKISDLSEDVAKFYVCEGKKDNPDCFTLQIQNDYYLAGKVTDRHQSIYYHKNQKAQVDWIFETPDGYNEDFIVNYDLEEDYWLMFNKISSSDIRFNMYDSNEQTLMKKPTIYRKTIIR